MALCSEYCNLEEHPHKFNKYFQLPPFKTLTAQHYTLQLEIYNQMASHSNK